jgi:hypothetical protein
MVTEMALRQHFHALALSALAWACGGGGGPGDGSDGSVSTTSSGNADTTGMDAPASPGVRPRLEMPISRRAPGQRATSAGCRRKNSNIAALASMSRLTEPARRSQSAASPGHVWPPPSMV